MIDRQQLLADLKPLLRELEADLRARCDEVAQINADLTKEYEQARAANRAGVTFEEWRADLITQVAVAWVLSCVFVRFLEDNALISPPRISGPLHEAGDGQGLMRARDERDAFFRSHPTQTDRDYLLAIFDDLAKVPGVKDVFGSHNPVSAYRYWLSGDAAQKLIEFFQKIDTDGTGEIIHDFADDQWDTRFLGDLYQDLSEAARKKYALLQTPIFIEEFILERTLEPAIKEFGLKDFRMIDPACGSGHFLLGSFTRILNHWRKAEPGTNDRERVNRTLASVHGVDLNPYAVAIARFRLLLTAMRECQVTRLKDAPGFQFNLVCGDSLLHGSVGQQVLGFHELAHHYQSENIDELRRILGPGKYHAVVANPPYVQPKDKSLNDTYRDHYPKACHGKYPLAAPFIQRLFELAMLNGFTGQITSNAFMKQQFGRKLVENLFPTLEVTHVIDTTGVYLPGHGTPTVILLGRQRQPIADSVRTVMGLRGEPATPAEGSNGFVWDAILDQIDRPHSVSDFVHVEDFPRERFNKHPWSIGGGGAADLKATIDAMAKRTLGSCTTSIGIVCFTLEDDVYFIPASAARRCRIRRKHVRPIVMGDTVRDWLASECDVTVFPYDDRYQPIQEDFQDPCFRYLWRNRTCLSNSIMFGRKTKVDAGLRWYEYGRLTHHKLKSPLSIIFGNVSSHNHFSLDRGGKIFNSHAAVIKLPDKAGIDDHFGLLAVLNSSLACFWMKQVFFPKGGDHVGSEGARVRRTWWDERYEFGGTGLQAFPLPDTLPQHLAAAMDEIAGKVTTLTPSTALTLGTPTESLIEYRTRREELLQEMIAIQEELDWECYSAYGLTDGTSCCTNPPRIELGQRAFEIVLARKVAGGREETTWFVRHGSTPITEVPTEWPEEYKKVVEKRIEIIGRDRNIGLIERPEYKRRWNVEPWEQQQERALRNWLLARLESYFDFDGRMNDQKTVTARGNLHEPRLTSIAKVADLAKQDKDFMQVAELYAGRMDFDVGNLVGDLIAAESVPCLPVLRYKPSGVDKRIAWERTWELQRQEDAVDALFEVQRLKKIESGKVQETLRPLVAALRIEEQARAEVLREAANAAGYITEAAKQKLDLTSDLILKPVTDAAKRAKQAAVGEIPVPPKYTSADFLSGNFWRLRGKLDVPKECWVSFPHCEGEDGTLMIAWAGYDHLQLVRAIAERYEHAKEHEGRRLVPLLACIGQQIPWLKQWHNDLDPVFGSRMGDYFENYLAEEAKALGMTVAEVMAWAPPERHGRRGGRRRSTGAAES